MQMFAKELQEDLIDFINKMCFCNISLSDFTYSAIKCLHDAVGAVQLNTTLTYSSDNGAVIAASVIAQVSFKVMSSSKLLIGNNTWIRAIQHSNSGVLQLKVKPSSSGISIGVGAFFGGVVLTTLCYGIILTLYCSRCDLIASHFEIILLCLLKLLIAIILKDITNYET